MRACAEEQATREHNRERERERTTDRLNDTATPTEYGAIVCVCACVRAGGGCAVRLGAVGCVQGISEPRACEKRGQLNGLAPHTPRTPRHPQCTPTRSRAAQPPPARSNNTATTALGTHDDDDAAHANFAYSDRHRTVLGAAAYYATLPHYLVINYQPGHVAVVQ
jgi:hypothetical protein